MKKNIFKIVLVIILPSLIFSQIMNVHSDKGNTQFNIADVDSITFSSSVSIMKWIGHASVKIKTNDGIVIYIDPFAGAESEYSEAADIILVTHGLSDHNQVNKVTTNGETQIFSGKSANVGGTKMEISDSIEVQGIKIKAVYAYNSNHVKGDCAGFVLYLEGKKLYHSGDTSNLNEMVELTPLNLDYALLCIDGVFNMGPEEAMEVAAIIQAKNVIPIHVAPSSASEEVKQMNIDAFNPDNKLILNEGNSIYL